MPDMYLYVSKQKVAQLSDQSPSFFRGITAKLDFKFPFFSGGLSGQHQDSTLADLKRLIPKLHKHFDLPSAENVARTGVPPVLFKFRGFGARQLEDGQFWLAIECRKTALLLAGSAVNAMGGGASVGANISPSADPVGAIRLLLEDHDKAPKQKMRISLIRRDLSYLWQALMYPVLTSSVVLPQLEGIAVFCALLPTDPDQLARVNRSALDTMLVGTPLYVRQVES